MGHRHDHCGIWTGQADLRYRSGGTAINGCEVNCLAPRVKARIVADSSQEFGDRESQSDYRSRSKQLEGVLEQGGRLSIERAVRGNATGAEQAALLPKTRIGVCQEGFSVNTKLLILMPVAPPPSLNGASACRVARKCCALS
jgi:hypothetical protein